MLTVAQTRWQVIGPALLQMLPADTAAGPTADDSSLAPFEALVKVAEGANDVPAGNHAESAGVWLALWRQHWDREKAVIRQRAPSSPLAPASAAQLQTYENEVADLLNTPVPNAPAGTAPDGSLEVTTVSDSRSA